MSKQFYISCMDPSIIIDFSRCFSTIYSEVEFNPSSGLGAILQ